MLDQLAANLAQHLALSETEFLHFSSLLQRRRVRPRQSVIQPGDPRGIDVFVDAGCLRVYSITHEGSERILHFAIESTHWCHATLPRVPFDIGIDALEPSDVLLLERSSKERLCREVPTFDRVFRFLAQNSIQALQQRLVLSLQNTAEERYQEFRRIHPALEGRIPRYHIASYLGICPEFFSKVRKDLAIRRAS